MNKKELSLKILKIIASKVDFVNKYKDQCVNENSCLWISGYESAVKEILEDYKELFKDEI